MKTYALKEGYQTNRVLNERATEYKDDEHNSASFQVNVYKYARKIIVQNGISKALDIGCGFGMKLKKFISPVCKDIVGIDREHAIDYCKSEHGFGRWLIDDIENPNRKLSEQFELIIVSDVIEHLDKPDKLFEYVIPYCNADTQIIFSTPERDRMRGKNHFGPPPNAQHVREWNYSEFKEYMQSMDANIIKHFLVGEQRSFINIFKKWLHLESIKNGQVVHFRLKKSELT
ncbi:MAG: hypothetical protein [Olavius algarvensis Delta 4 endosymbiont]|nr:MAG: hypothetical protein [Olavius algarvensis Delta 4 endosymbiont]